MGVRTALVYLFKYRRGGGGREKGERGVGGRERGKGGGEDLYWVYEWHWFICLYTQEGGERKGNIWW